MRKTSSIAIGVILLVSLSACTKEARKARLAQRGENYFHSGDYDKAKLEYLNLLRLEPENAISYLRLGHIWSEQGALLRAAPCLLKARELLPDNVDNRVRLARTFLVLGRRGDGFAEAMRVLQQAPNNGEAARLAVESALNEEDLKRVEAALERMPQENGDRRLAAALIAVRLGNRDQARQMTESALASEPKSAAAHSLMGVILLAEKQTGQAAEEFRQAAELSPVRSGERVRYAQFQLQTGAPDEAVKTLTSITKAAPDFLPAWLLLAEISLGKKKYDESLTFVRNVLSRDPGNLDGTILEAKNLNAKGEADRAIQTLQQADTQYPNFPPIKVELARCYLQKNDPAQAATFLNQALAAKPDYAEAILLLAQINLRTGKAQAVVESMSSFASNHPENPVAKFLLADAYRVLGQLDDAAKIFRDQLTTSPNSADACLALGIILAQQKKNDEARAMLERAQQLAPNNPLPLSHLINFDLANGNIASAQHRIDEQIQSNPNSAVNYFLQGRIWAAQSNWPKAEEAFKKTLELNPNLTAAYQMLAATYIQSNRQADAIHQLEQVIAREPKDIRSLMSLATLYEKTGAPEKSRETYERLIAIAPDFAPALNNLAYIYLERLKQVDRAYQLAEKARSLQPGEGSIADTLGWVLFRKRDYSQALTLLNDAAAKSPSDPEIQYHLGMCHYMMGSTDAAKTAFEQSLKGTADFAGKVEAQRRLNLITQKSDATLPLEQLEAMIKSQPDDVPARVHLADKYKAGGRPRDAAAQLDEVLKLNPRFVPAVVRLAELYSESLNDQSKAQDYANTARQLAPADAGTLALVGRVAFKSGNYSWAYSVLKQASDQISSDAVAASAFGWAAFYVGKTAEATQAMERVVKLAPGTPSAEDARTWLEMMEIESGARVEKDAAPKVDAVLKKDPNYAPAQLARAALLAKSDAVKSAIDVYQKVLARFPDCAMAEKRLAALYLRQPDTLEKAADLAIRARRAQPDDIDVMRTEARISYQRKDYARALELLDQSASKQALTPDDLYYKGICALQTNDAPHAREALTQALAGGLPDPLAAEAKRALGQIK